MCQTLLEQCQQRRMAWEAQFALSSKPLKPMSAKAVSKARECMQTARQTGCSVSRGENMPCPTAECFSLARMLTAVSVYAQVDIHHLGKVQLKGLSSAIDVVHICSKRLSARNFQAPSFSSKATFLGSGRGHIFSILPLSSKGAT